MSKESFMRALIVEKVWRERTDNNPVNCRGWYLFGFIPLYIRRASGWWDKF